MTTREEALSYGLSFPDPIGIPCYRVVSGKGECSGSFAFGGPEAQAERLRKDGVEVTGGKVDLKKYGWHQPGANPEVRICL